MHFAILKDHHGKESIKGINLEIQRQLRITSSSSSGQDWKPETQVRIICFCSFPKSCPNLWPDKLQHARLLCSSLSPWACSNSCSLNQWGHPTISSSVTPFSSCSQSFPASGSFQMSWHFAPGGQSIRASASTPVLPMNIQLISFRIDWLDLLAVQGTLKSLLQHYGSKASILRRSTLWFNSHIHTWLLEKP